MRSEEGKVFEFWRRCPALAGVHCSCAWAPSYLIKRPSPFLQKLKTPRLRASARLKRRSFGLKLPQEGLMGLPLLRGQVVDEEDAVEVVDLVLGGA